MAAQSLRSDLGGLLTAPGPSASLQRKGGWEPGRCVHSCYKHGPCVKLTLMQLGRH